MIWHKKLIATICILHRNFKCNLTAYKKVIAEFLLHHEMPQIGWIRILLESETLFYLNLEAEWLH